MEAPNNLILPALILIPFIAGFACWLVDKLDKHLPRYIALIGMLVTLALTIALWQTGTYTYELGGAAPTWAAEFKLPWIQTLGINIHLAVDGLSLLMILLTGLLGVLSWVLYGSAKLGAVMTAAMTLNLLLAALVGVLAPMIRNRLGQDPAVGSSVIITAVTDSGGFFIFLGLATIFLM